MDKQNYEIRAKKRREAWNIYKALRKDNIYKKSDKYTKAYTTAKEILLNFCKDYPFKYSNLTNTDFEFGLNELADVEICKGKVIELTDEIISEFLPIND